MYDVRSYYDFPAEAINFLEMLEIFLNLPKNFFLFLGLGGHRFPWEEWNALILCKHDTMGLRLHNDNNPYKINCIIIINIIIVIFIIIIIIIIDRLIGLVVSMSGSGFDPRHFHKF